MRLLTRQVRIMRRVDEIVRQREAHVLRLIQFFWWNDSVLVAGQIAGERLERDGPYKMTSTEEEKKHDEKKESQKYYIFH